MLCLATCAVLLSIRFYHWWLQKIKDTKLTVTCVSCMVLALLYCFELLMTEFKSFSGSSGDKLYCDVSMKLITVTYALHRILIYIFIILRLELITQSGSQSSRIICAGKAVIGVCGTFLVIAAMSYINGILDLNFHCKFESKNLVLIMMFMIDTFICISGTWLFIHPLSLYLRDIEDSSLRNFLRTTKIWSLVCLVSTLLVMVIIVIVDGAALIAVFDCSITAFSLLMMMSPKRHKGLSENISRSCDRSCGAVGDQSCCSQRTIPWTQSISYTLPKKISIDMQLNISASFVH